MHFASCSFLSLTIPSLPSSSFINFLLLLLLSGTNRPMQNRREELAWRTFGHGCLNSQAPYWEPGGFVVAQLPGGSGCSACLSTLWPYSVSPCSWCRLGPIWGGTKSPPPSLSPSVSLCLQHHAPKHSTGKWWEEKLKFANCWEMQREEGVSVSRKSRIFRPKQIFGLRYWKHSDLEQVRFNTDITVN